MSRVIVDSKDFELLIRLYEEVCKGNKLIFSIDNYENLEVQLQNAFNEEINVVVYKAGDSGSNLMPTVTVKDRLSNFLQSKKTKRTLD